MGIISSSFNLIETINCIFLAIIFLIGIVITHEDARWGKIRNKWIKLGFIGGGTLYLFLFLLSILGYQAIKIFNNSFFYYPFSYYPRIIVNFVLSVLTAYLFWQYRFWSAGDGKLFILFSFLLPPQYYSDGFLPYLPLSALLVNIFIPPFLFLTVKIIWHFFKHLKFTFRRETFSAFIVQCSPQMIKANIQENIKNKKAVFVFANASFLSFMILPILKHQIISLPLSVVQSGLGLFVLFYFLNHSLYRYLERLLKNNAVLILFSVFAVSYLVFGYFYWRDILFSSLTMVLKISFCFMLLLMIFKKCADLYINEKEVLKIGTGDLKAKMILTDETIEMIKNDKAFFQQLGDIYCDGLTQHQVGILKKWLIKMGAEELMIYKNFSFASWIVLGTLITIAIKQSLLFLFLRTLSHV